MFIPFVKYNDRERNEKEIGNHHGDRSPKIRNITLSNAFAEKDTVMVDSTDAHLTIFTVVHVQSNCHIAFLAEYHRFTVYFLYFWSVVTAKVFWVTALYILVTIFFFISLIIILSFSYIIWILNII